MTVNVEAITLLTSNVQRLSHYQSEDHLHTQVHKKSLLCFRTSSQIIGGTFNGKPAQAFAAQKRQEVGGETVWLNGNKFRFPLATVE